MSVATSQCVKDLLGLVGKPGWVEFLAMPESTNQPSDDASSPGSGKPAVVIFDMGGVLVRLASLPDLLGVGQETADFWSRWLASPAVRTFERGDGAPEVFADQLVEELDLAITPDQFLANFVRFCTGLYPGAADLVNEVGSQVQTAVLSNTNALHWNNQADAAVIQTLCDRSYLSFQLGLLKPDAAIYRHVAADLGVRAEDIVFLDDNQINVDGARRAGWQAHVVAGPGQARDCLVRLGLLDGGTS